MPQYQGNELTPARKSITAAPAIVLLSELLEFKSQYRFQKLPKYAMIESNGPVSLFYPMIYGESILSKRPTL